MRGTASSQELRPPFAGTVCRDDAVLKNLSVLASNFVEQKGTVVHTMTKALQLSEILNHYRNRACTRAIYAIEIGEFISKS